MAEFTHESHLLPKFGPKGVEIPIINELIDIHDVKLIDKIIVEILQPFKKELGYNSNDTIFDSVLKSDTTNLLKTLRHLNTGPDYQDKKGNTPLMVAAQTGQLNIVRSLAHQGASVKSKSIDGKSALYAATVNNHNDIVTWLASNGADVNIADEEGTTPLLISSYAGNYDATKELLDMGAKINWEDNHGRTPLMAASQQGNVTIVELLISRKVDVKQQTISGKSALFYAAMKDNKKVVKLLIQSNKELVNLQDKCGNTVIAMCSQHGYAEMVKLLHSLGGQLNVCDVQGRTPIFAAIQDDHLEIVTYLVANGANINIKSVGGKTALSYAVSLQHKHIVQFLAKQSTNVDDADDNGDTPLNISAYKGDVHIVETLIDKSSNINHQNKDGKSALMNASCCGHLSVVKILIRKGADVNLKSKRGLTALDIALLKDQKAATACLESTGALKSANSHTENSEHLLLASSVGNYTMVKQLLAEKANVNFQDDRGCTPLMLASQRGHIDILKLILEKGVNVNQKNKNGVTALAYAIEGNQIKAVDCLLGFDADMMLVDNDQKTLLYSCAENGQIKNVKEIIMLGVDVNHKSKGKTPLMVASEFGHENIASYLISMGADVELNSADGFKAIDYAFMNDHVNIQQLLTQNPKKCEIEGGINLGEYLVIACTKSNIQKAEKLLKQGVTANYQDKNNNAVTPLFISCQKGHPAIVQLLLSYGANVHLRTDVGDTALIAASLNGFTEIVELLLEQNACPNASDNKGRTSLMCAAQNGHQDIVHCLISKGALLNIKGKRGVSAMLFACTNGNIHIVEALIQYDIEIDSADNEHLTPLIISSLNGYLPIVELLVDQRAKINCSDFHGRNALMAACQNGHMKVVEFLVGKEADMNNVTSTGMTARDYALVNGHKEVSEWLARKGAKGGVGQMLQTSKRNILSSRGFGIYSSVQGKETKQVQKTSKPSIEQQAQKSLIDMCENGWGFEDAVSYTVLKGANVNLKDDKGLGPIMIALKNGHTSHAKWLINMGADVNSTDTDLCTPLMHATKIGDLSLVKILVEHKAMLNTLDSQGNNALVYAKNAKSYKVFTYLLQCVYGSIHCSLIASIMEGDLEKVDIILKERIDLNQCDSDGKTALVHCALSSTDKTSAITGLLCKCGADIDRLDQNGDTALLTAIRSSNLPCVQTLISHGANLLVCNKFQQDALLEACILGSLDILHSILKEMGNFNKSSISKALHCVTFGNDIPVFKLFFYYYKSSVIDVLNTEDFFKKCLKDNKNDVVMKHYIGHGFNIRNVHIEKPTAIMYAVVEGQYDIVELLCVLEEDWMCAVGGAFNIGKFEIAIKWLDIKSNMGNARNVAVTFGEDNICLICGDLRNWEEGSHSYMYLDNQHKMEDLLQAGIITGEQDDDETIASLNKTMNVIYKAFTRIMIRESPKCIEGFTRDWFKPSIYIKIDKEQENYAKKFIKEKVIKENPAMAIVTFEYIISRCDISYLMLQNEIAEFTEKTKSGSIIFESKNCLAKKLVRGEVNKSSVEMKFGTLACFMFNHENGMAFGDSSVWGVTVGHTFFPKQPLKSTVLLSEYSAPGYRTDKICVIANRYEADIDIIEVEENYKTIDIATFPLLLPTEMLNLYSVSIDGIESPEIFRGADRFLINRKVFKLGTVTGRTEGIIKQVDETITINGKPHYGLFRIESADRSIPFAVKGDSGSVVLDLQQGYVLGLICALDEPPEDCTSEIVSYIYCTRFDHTLQFVEDKWNVVLSFNKKTDTISTSVVNINQCNCGSFEEAERLRKELHREKQKRLDQEAILVNLQYKVKKDEIAVREVTRLSEENKELRKQKEALERQLEKYQQEETLMFTTLRP